MDILADKNKDNINLSLTFPGIRDQRRSLSMYIPEAFLQQELREGMEPKP